MGKGNGETAGGGAQNELLQDMIAEADTGARKPDNPLIHRFLLLTALTWSVFQVYVASPLVLEFTPWMNETVVKQIHLAFSIFLTFLSYPAFKTSPRRHIPVLDWGLAIVAAATCLYLVALKDSLAMRPGAPIQADVVVAVIGVVLLLEATRRALGPPLMVVAIVFLTYAFAGSHMPDVIAHQGASVNKAASHYWLLTEGVFGVAIGVSATMVFLFVLFGALLEQAGAGNYFIRVAFSLLGHLRGGPAKAAVVSSAMTGMISGSSIANVVTTGTFTIPLMKKVGFPPEKAGAVEVASSTNGQLTPPIMGAAAFLMVEYVGISYIEVIKHAFLPAIISYIALVYIVHLEAMKAGMRGLPRVHGMGLKGRLIGVSSVLIVLGALVWVLPPTMGWTKDVAGDATPWVMAGVLILAYLALLRVATRVPDLPPSHEIDQLPPVGPTVKAGLHFLLPVLVLVWLLTVERFSPGLSAFWAVVFMAFIVVTQKPLKALMRGDDEREARVVAEGFTDLVGGLINGARNMVGIGVATATAGIVVGTVTLTGLGQVMIEFVELISGGQLILVLIFTAMISLLLGMGLPTTANYIVVSSLMAPVIVSLGTESGLIVPMIAAHMFVFYFGILADDTPPVGLAAFAAAAISRGDPIRTGLQGFMYDIRTAILPFLFIFNTELLMINIEGPVHLAMVVAAAVGAMMMFAAATQGFFVTRNRAYETLALLLIAFTLFRPGYFWDKVYDPYERHAPAEVVAEFGRLAPGTDIHINLLGRDVNQKPFTRILRIRVPEDAAGAAFDDPAERGLARFDRSLGMQPELFDDNLEVFVTWGGYAERQGVQNGWRIVSLDVPSDRPPKQIMFLPAILLAGLVYLSQARRARRAATATA